MFSKIALPAALCLAGTTAGAATLNLHYGFDVTLDSRTFISSTIEYSGPEVGDTGIGEISFIIDTETLASSSFRCIALGINCSISPFFFSFNERDGSFSLTTLGSFDRAANISFGPSFGGISFFENPNDGVNDDPLGASSYGLSANINTIRGLPSVPLPASLPLLLAALAVTGVAGKRRKAKNFAKVM